MLRNSQGSRGFGKDEATLQEEKGLKVLGGKLKLLKNLLRMFRLKGPNLKLPMRIAIYHKIHPGVAPIADSIKNNDPLMPGPFMGSWDTFAVHLPPLMGHGQVICLLQADTTLLHEERIYCTALKQRGL